MTIRVKLLRIYRPQNIGTLQEDALGKAGGTPLPPPRPTWEILLYGGMEVRVRTGLWVGSVLCIAPGVYLTREEVEKLVEEMKEVEKGEGVERKAEADAATACLAMIGEELAKMKCLHEMQGAHDIPVLYPEWVACVVAKAREEEREKGKGSKGSAESEPGS